jgi:crystallin alpha B
MEFFSSRQRHCGSNPSGSCGRRALQDMFGMDWNDWNLHLSLLSDNYVKGDEKAVNTKVSPVMNNEKKFEIKLDVSHYLPEEITVTIVDNNVVIDCKHEEKKDDYGWISREITRKFELPEDLDIEKVESSLSSNGVLTVQLPKKIFKTKEENVILIPVIHEKESVNSEEVNDTNSGVNDAVDDGKHEQQKEN